MTSQVNIDQFRPVARTKTVTNVAPIPARGDGTGTRGWKACPESAKDAPFVGGTVIEPLCYQEPSKPSVDQSRRKRKSFDAEGEVHEYTFSTYRRQPFLTNHDFNRIFLENLSRARMEHGFLVWAYVLMPDHVHLLIPARKALTRDILSSIKQPVTKRIAWATGIDQ